jgi:hypothetical protein
LTQPKLNFGPVDPVHSLDQLTLDREIRLNRRLFFLDQLTLDEIAVPRRLFSLDQLTRSETFGVSLYTLGPVDLGLRSNFGPVDPVISARPVDPYGTLVEVTRRVDRLTLYRILDQF